MADLYRCVCIPFGEKTGVMAVYPGWRSLTLADPGLTYVSPSGNFPRRTALAGPAGRGRGGAAGGSASREFRLRGRTTESSDVGAGASKCVLAAGGVVRAARAFGQAVLPVR